MFKHVSLSRFLPLLICVLASPAFANEDSFVAPELDAFAQEKVRKAFVAANPGLRWKESSISVFATSGFVQYALGWNGGTDPSEPVAVKIAREFISRNAAALGIDAEYVDKLEYRYGPSLLGNVVAKASKLSYPGYEEMKGFTYNVELLLKVRNNSVVALVNRNNRLAFNLPRLSQNPSLRGDDMKVRNQLIGREMTYADSAGKTQSAGWVGPQNLSAAELVVHTKALGGGHGTRVELAWRYEVTVRGLAWTFYFSAHNGELIETRQNFST